MPIAPDEQKAPEPDPAASPEKPSLPIASPQMRLMPWLISLGVIAVVLAIIVPPQKVEEGDTGAGRSKVSRVRNDLRSISTALEAYFVDNNDYPACAKGDLGVNAFMLKKEAPERNIWTFRISRGEGDAMSLTTPVAFMSSMPSDPFANYRGSSFGYYANDRGWIMWSCGPDSVYDIDPEKDYDADTTNPLPSLIMKTYDPTNGSVSRGDVWRIKG